MQGLRNPGLFRAFFRAHGSRWRWRSAGATRPWPRRDRRSTPAAPRHRPFPRVRRKTPRYRQLAPRQAGGVNMRGAVGHGVRSRIEVRLQLGQRRAPDRRRVGTGAARLRPLKSVLHLRRQGRGRSGRGRNRPPRSARAEAFRLRRVLRGRRRGRRGRRQRREGARKEAEHGILQIRRRACRRRGCPRGRRRSRRWRGR